MTDLRKGIYRRIYSGFLWGKRINSVSLECEAWFWRLLVVADDFGNLPAEEARLSALTKGARHKLRDSDVAAYCACLEMAGLIAKYTDDGEAFYHIHDFEQLQPAPRNGRLIQKYPPYSELGSPGESGGVRGSPGESSPPIPIPIPIPISINNTNPSIAAVAAGVSPEELQKRTEYLLVRPEWVKTGLPWLTQSAAADLAAMPITKADVDRVYSEARKSRETLKNPAGYVVAELRKVAASLNGGAH